MMKSKKEAYAKLRPPVLTPKDEMCACTSETPIKLMCALSYNPIHCVLCNLEIPPERLNFSVELIESVAHWRSLYDAIDRLWLDSGEYERWAKQQLCDMNSPVNRLGRQIQQQLTHVHHCYYWYFQDQSSDAYVPFSVCPVCNGELEEISEGLFMQRVCEHCGIIGAGEEIVNT